MGTEEQSPPWEEIPEPEDDGEADHLVGQSVPPVELTATDGQSVDLSSYFDRIILFCFPKMGRTSDEPDPDGWEKIPGAYGCTEESCSFRDHYQELTQLGAAEVFGLSLQSSEHQRDTQARIEPPYEFLSDADHKLTDGLRLPTFEVEGEIFNKRLTLVILDGRIEHVFYPVYPPGEHAEEVIRWLEAKPRTGSSE